RKSEVERNRKRPPPGSDREDLPNLARTTAPSFSPSTILKLQRTIGNQAVRRLMGHTLQRAPGGGATEVVGNAPKVPTVADAKLDAGEAASLVELRLFDSNGYFATVKDEINKFKSDMTTELGWYAGDKKESDEKLSPYIEVGVDKAKE